MAGTPRSIDAVPGKPGGGKGAGDRLLRAISHPVRIEILRALGTRVASPKELAAELGESVTNVSYHFKYLRQEGCIEILDTEPRRGAVEHYYRAKAPAHEERLGVAIRDLIGEAVLALNAGTFGASEGSRPGWRSMELDERGRRELLERQAEWLAQLDRIEAEAAARIAAGGGGARRVVAAAMAFEAPPDPGSAAGDAEP